MNIVRRTLSLTHRTDTPHTPQRAGSTRHPCTGQVRQTLQRRLLEGRIQRS